MFYWLERKTINFINQSPHIYIQQYNTIMLDQYQLIKIYNI